jgi:hypothetical protein
MIKLTLISAILFLSINSRNNCPWGNEKVCGKDHRTYADSCAIAAAYVQVDHMGPCTKEVRIIVTEEGVEEEVLQSNCPQVFMPVCGKDYVTYMNACTLGYNEEDLAHEGPCGIKRSHRVFELLNTEEPIECDCLGEAFRPVCSLAGFTYENKCVLNCTQ